MKFMKPRAVISVGVALLAFPLASAAAPYDRAPHPMKQASQVPPAPGPIQCTPPVPTPVPAPTPVPVADVNISMSANQYFPSQISIRVGQTVSWTNNEGQPHTVTDNPCLAKNPENSLLPAGAEPFDSGTLNFGETYAKTFTVPGEYRYFCQFHEGGGMVGTIFVSP